MGRPRKSGNTAKKATKKAETKQEQIVDTNDMMQTAESVEQMPENESAEPVVEQTEEPTEEQTVAEEPAAEEEPKQEAETVEPKDLPKEENIEVKYSPTDDDTREMLNFVGITSIPRYQSSAVWVRAIAKVLKIDTSVSWVVLKRTGAKTHNIEKIFGHCAAIKKVGTPIPIEVIPYNYSAAFPSNNSYEMAKFISQYTGENAEEWQQKTMTELTDKMLDIQIQMYYEDLRKNGTVNL